MSKEKIKQLQNNFTTPDQSKRLLELGLPEESADCYYHHYFTNDPAPLLRVLQPQWDETIGAIRGKSGQKIEPCWSVGRLMEIAHLCSGSTFSYKEEADELKKFKETHKCKTIIEAIIMCIEDACSIGGMDFSKLEE